MNDPGTNTSEKENDADRTVGEYDTEGGEVTDGGNVGATAPRLYSASIS